MTQYVFTILLIDEVLILNSWCSDIKHWTANSGNPAVSDKHSDSLGYILHKEN